MFPFQGHKYRQHNNMEPISTPAWEIMKPGEKAAPPTPASHTDPRMVLLEVAARGRPRAPIGISQKTHSDLGHVG